MPRQPASRPGILRVDLPVPTVMESLAQDVAVFGEAIQRGRQSCQGHKRSVRERIQPSIPEHQFGQGDVDLHVADVD